MWAPQSCARSYIFGAYIIHSYLTGAEAAIGMNFDINDDQKELLDLAERFTKEEIIPNAPHYDTTGEYPWPVLKKAHELGLMNLHISQEYGGACSVY